MSTSPFSDSSCRLFLPAAGYGNDSNLRGSGLDGGYGSSTPHSGDSSSAWGLYFYSRLFFGRSDNYRYSGQSVRPVRGSAQ